MPALLTCARPAPVGMLTLTLVVALSGCVNPRKVPEEFNFTTHITENGYKMFQLSYPTLRPSYREQQNPRASGDQFRHRQRYISRVLDLAVEQSQYCREGYMQLGRYAGETTERVRGECRELATEADRQDFPNSLQRW